MSEQSSTTRARVVYLSHGGGPLPLLGDPGHGAMVRFMQGLPLLVGMPEAILVISAHWEEPVATLTSAPAPPMLYDYYGFPPKTYTVQYPAPGAPALAERVAGMLANAGIASRQDPQRGYDHGLFIPLLLAYPQADIPCLQLSLLAGLDPAAHLALGRALQPLLSENILVVGSGFSFHNLRAFFRNNADVPDELNDAFQDWLIATCTGPLGAAAREEHLARWQAAPGARHCHPREEHLLPLHVCAGMAGAPARVIFDEAIMGKRSVAFLWRQAATER